MFKLCLKHYYEELRTSISPQAETNQTSTDHIRIQKSAKRPGSSFLYPPSPEQTCDRKSTNTESLGFYSRLFLVPKPQQKWRPVIDLSRLNQFLRIERFKMETPESIRTSLNTGEWVTSIDLQDAYRHIPIHPRSRKYLTFAHRSQIYQFTSLPFGLAPAPQVITMIVKEVKLMALSRGIRIHQYIDDWLIGAQSPEESAHNTKVVVNLTESLGWIINQVKSELTPTPVFSFVGYEYHLNSALVKPTQERWQKLNCKTFDVAHWIASINRKNGLGRPPSHETFSVASQGELDISSVAGQAPSLVRLHNSSSELVAESSKCSQRCGSPPPRTQHSSVYRCLKRRLGRSLKSRPYQWTVVRSRKIIAHKHFRTKSSVLGSKTLQDSMPKSNSPRCHGQLNSSSLHQQIGWKYAPFYGES